MTRRTEGTVPPNEYQFRCVHLVQAAANDPSAANLIALYNQGVNDCMDSYARRRDVIFGILRREAVEKVGQ